VGELDGIDGDAGEDLAVLPRFSAVLAAEQVGELADDPAELAIGGQAVDVVERHVLEDRLTVADAILVEGGEPDELRMRLADGQGVVAPGLAAIRRDDPCTPLADRDRLGLAHGFDREELHALVILRRVLPLPGLAAIVRAKDEAELPDRPAVEIVGHADVVDQLLGPRRRLRPALAPVVAPIDRAPVAGREHEIVVDDGDGEEIVEDPDLTVVPLRVEVDFVTSQGEEQRAGERCKRAQAEGHSKDLS
jgi:hypothetical protein